MKLGAIRGAKQVCSGALVLGAALRPSPAFAAELTWSAPETCPGAEQARSALEEALGEPLSQAEPLSFDVRVELETDGTARAIVTVREDSASAAPKQRVIVAMSCSEATDAAVVAMALALASGQTSGDDSVSGTGHSDGAPSAADDNEHATGSAAAKPPASARSSETGAGRLPSASAVRASTEAGFVVDYGSLPRLAPGAEIGMAVGWRQVGARLTGVLFPKTSTTVKGDAGASFTLLAAALAVCGRTAGTVYVAETCVGSELGRLLGRGFGVTHQDDASSLWVAPRADVTLRIGLGRSWAGFLRGGAAVPLVRDRFKLNNVGPVHQTDSAVWRLGIGLWFEL